MLQGLRIGIWAALALVLGGTAVWYQLSAFHYSAALGQPATVPAFAVTPIAAFVIANRRCTAAAVGAHRRGPAVGRFAAGRRSLRRWAQTVLLATLAAAGVMTFLGTQQAALATQLPASWFSGTAVRHGGAHPRRRSGSTRSPPASSRSSRTSSRPSPPGARSSRSSTASDVDAVAHRSAIASTWSGSSPRLRSACCSGSTCTPTKATAGTARSGLVGGQRRPLPQVTLSARPRPGAHVLQRRDRWHTRTRRCADGGPWLALTVAIAAAIALVVSGRRRNAAPTLSRAGG